MYWQTIAFRNLFYPKMQSVHRIQVVLKNLYICIYVAGSVETEETERAEDSPHASIKKKKTFFILYSIGNNYI
jgi:hypothetical protein